MSIHARDGSVAGTRRQLLSLSAVVAIVLVAIVVIALYGMYRLDQAVAANGARIDRLTEMADAARVAQVTFKTQVQEWKNTLLRGFEAKDFDAYHGAFLAQRDEVEKKLDALAAQAQAVGFATDGLTALKAAHEELDKAYDEGLTFFKVDDPLSIRVVDAHVRGRDRPVNDAFDTFVAAVKSFTDEKRTALRQEIAGVAASMRTTLYVSLAIGLLVLLVGAFLAMRAIRTS